MCMMLIEYDFCCPDNITLTDVSYLSSSVKYNKRQYNSLLWILTKRAPLVSNNESTIGVK